MYVWGLRLRRFWLEHPNIIGLALGAAVVVACGSVAFLVTYGVRPTFKPPVTTPTEGMVIGFAGPRSLTAYVRTEDNRYGLVDLPYGSGCRSGDRIFLTRWQVNGRLGLRARPPGCLRAFG
jgi:hypothetical protein